MRYSFVSAAFLASSVVAQAQTQTVEGYNAFTAPVKDAVLTAGSTVEVTWQLGKFPTGSSTLTLLQGGPTFGNLSLGPVIATGIKNADQKYSWTIPKDTAPHDLYGLQFTVEDDKSTPDVDESVNATTKAKLIQYGFPFKINTSGGSYGGSGTTTVKIGTGPAYTPPATTSSHAAEHNTTLTTASSTSKPTGGSNYTAPTTTRSSSPGATTSTPPRQSTNAGVNNVVSGGMALIGGLVVALAL